MKRIVSLLLCALTLVACLAGCGDSQTAAKTFTVGFDANLPPMGFTAEDGSYTGFDIDCATEVAKRMGRELKLQPIDWDSKDFELNSGNIDCIWNGFTMNIDDRPEKYTWTDAYMNNEQVAVVKKDSAYQSLADLAGKNVAVQAGSTADSAVNAKAEFKASIGQIVDTPDNLLALEQLKTGAVDAVVMDSVVANYQIAQGAEVRIINDVLSTELYGIGFKKGNTELRDEVQKYLKEMAADGTLAKISTKWFSSDIPTIGK